MRPSHRQDQPLRVTATATEVVFLGDGPVGFSMTPQAARLTLHNLAQALLSSRPPTFGRARAVVLLVDDDPLVREVAAALLEDAGYVVIATNGPRAALQALEVADEVHLLFTDIHMPGDLDGLQLARLVWDRWPTIAVLVTSGRPPQSLDDLPPGGRFVTKPYDAADVLRHIEELTGA